MWRPKKLQFLVLGTPPDTLEGSRGTKNGQYAFPQVKWLWLMPKNIFGGSNFQPTFSLWIAQKSDLERWRVWEWKFNIKIDKWQRSLIFFQILKEGGMFNWATCTLSLIVSNLSCFALCSYFFSILPTERNLLTYLNNLLVITMTFLVNFMVSKDYSKDINIPLLPHVYFRRSL